jgi:hypothetical protein
MVIYEDWFYENRYLTNKFGICTEQNCMKYLLITFNIIRTHTRWSELWYIV